MGHIQDDLGFTELALNSLVDRSAIVGSPTYNAITLAIELLRPIYKVIHEARFTSRAGVHKKVDGAIFVGLKRVEKVIATAQVAETSLVRAQPIRDAIPSPGVEITGTDFGFEKTHTAATV